MKKGAVTQPGQQNLDAQARLDFEILISDLSSEFINLDPEQIDIKINNALKRIASFMEVERAFFSNLINLKPSLLSPMCGRPLILQRIKLVPEL
jgi:hypothetical protein